MTNYCIKDWADNMIDEGPYSHIDDASEALTYIVFEQMERDEHCIKWVEDGGDFDEDVFDQYREEYVIEEIKE